MDSAVVRVKRRITDEPFDRFILNCKRAKLCESINDENQQPIDDDLTAATRTILKFATTVSADDDITTHLTKLRKAAAEELAKKVRKPASVISKLRQQLKNDAKEQRYKVINCFRSMHEPNTAGAEAKTTNITVVDIIKEEEEEREGRANSQAAISTCNAKPTGSTHQSDPNTFAQLDKFVYDLYLFDSGERPTEINPNDYISIRPFDDLVYQGADECLNDSDSNDSEDSNDEGNYRNDYPDTDSNFSINDDDIRIAVENLHVGSDDSSIDDDCNYGAEPVIEFMDPTPGDEFEYFKKYGRIQKHNRYYRTNVHRMVNENRDSDEDSTDNEENMDTDTSRSSNAQVSPLVTCDEED